MHFFIYLLLTVEGPSMGASLQRFAGSLVSPPFNLWYARFWPIAWYVLRLGVTGTPRLRMGHFTPASCRRAVFLHPFRNCAGDWLP